MSIRLLIGKITLHCNLLGTLHLLLNFDNNFDGYATNLHVSTTIKQCSQNLREPINIPLQFSVLLVLFLNIVTIHIMFPYTSCFIM